MWKRMARGVMAILTVVALVIPPPARACGPFFLTVIFIQTKHPDTPLRRYAAGELGILQPSYARSYLVVAYRALREEPLTSANSNRPWLCGSTAWPPPGPILRRTEPNGRPTRVKRGCKSGGPLQRRKRASRWTATNRKRRRSSTRCTFSNLKIALSRRLKRQP